MFFPRLHSLLLCIGALVGAATFGVVQFAPIAPPSAALPAGQVCLEVHSAGQGSVLVSSTGQPSALEGSRFYAPDTVVTLQPSPVRGWAFLRWSGDFSGRPSPLRVRLSGNASITAVFVRCDGVFSEFAACGPEPGEGEAEPYAVPEAEREEGELGVSAKSITCNFLLNGIGISPSTASQSIGKAGLRYYPATGDVALYIEHDVAQPTQAWISEVGALSKRVVELGDARNPILRFFSAAEIERLQGSTAYWVVIASEFHPKGEIGGLLYCETLKVERRGSLRAKSGGEGEGGSEGQGDGEGSMKGHVGGEGKSGGEGESGGAPEGPAPCAATMTAEFSMVMADTLSGSGESGMGAIRVTMDAYERMVGLWIRIEHNVAGANTAAIYAAAGNTPLVSLGNAASPVEHEFTSQEIAVLDQSGEVYIQIASANYPNGSIRGVPQPEEMIPVAFSGPLHVNAANTSHPQNGLCWETAYTDIQSAVTMAGLAGGGEVWVAQGTYGETRESAEPLGSLILYDDVAVYGGFTGVETAREARDAFANLTVIDGSAARPGGSGPEPAYHVVYGANLDSAVLDGFIITGGQGGSTAPANQGAGVYLTNAGTGVVLQRLTLTQNTATEGAGFYLLNSSPQIRNSRVVSNIAGEGGGMNLDNASPHLENVLFLGNAVIPIGYGAAVYAKNGSAPLLTNTTTAWNWSLGGAAIRTAAEDTASVGLLNSILWYNAVQDASGDISGWYTLSHGALEQTNTGCLRSNPLFWRSAYGSFTQDSTYDAYTNQTTFYDSAQSFTAGALAGSVAQLEPSESFLPDWPGHAVILENTATAFTVAGDRTDFGASGSWYRFVDGGLEAASPAVDRGTSSNAPAADYLGEARGYDGNPLVTGTDASDYDLGYLEYTGQAAPGVVDFADPDLQTAILAAMPGQQAPLTASAAAGVTSLNLSNLGLAELTGLEYFRGLQTLNLSNNAITDLSPLAGLENLEELDLSHNQLTDIGPLRYLTHLKRLRLHYNQIADITPLSGLTSLEYLDLGFGNPLEPNENFNFGATGTNLITSLSPLAGLTNLEYLNVAGNTGITSIAAVSNLSSLETLWLGSSAIADWSPLLNCADTLTLLGAINCGITNTDMGIMAQLTHLFGLALMLNEDLTDISGLSTLDLMLAAFAMSPIASIDVAAHWTNLSTAFMDGTAVTDLDGLAGLTSLNEASFSSCALTDISGLAGLASVERISLSNNAIVDISALETTTGVRELQLDGNQITDIQALVDNTGLGGEDWCNISNNPLSQEAVCVELPALRAKFNNEWNVQSDAVCGPQATLTITINGQGTSWPEPGEHEYAVNSRVWVNARPVGGSGYAFDHWQGDASSNDFGVEVVLDEDKSIEAVFVNSGYTFRTLTLQRTGDGQGSIEPGEGVMTYKDGQTAYINANANNGSGFGGWSGDVVSMRIGENVLMNANKSVTATFVQNGVPLTVSVSGNGSTDPWTGTHYYAPGVTVPLQAWENGDSWFERWEGSVNTTTLTASVVMSEPRAVTAVFSPKMRLDLAISGSGYTSLSPGTHYYHQNENVGLTAGAYSDAYFAYWDIAGQPVRTQPSITLTMDENHAVTAVFWYAYTAVNFPDAHLDQAVRAAIGKPTGQLYVNDLVNRGFTALDASETGVETLTGLEYCLDLTTLKLSNNDVGSLSPLSRLVKLTYLDLGFGNPLGDDGEVDMMSAGANKITDLSPLANLVNLEYLNVAGNWALTDISAISGLSHLQQFWAGSSAIADWSPLLDCADTLTLLGAVNCGVTDAGLGLVAQLENLTALALIANSGVTDISGLSGLNLQIAAFAYTGISSIDVAQNWPGLFLAFMDGTAVTDLDGLAGLTALQEVSFGDCQLTDISGLENLTSVQRISLPNNAITDISVLETTTGVRELQLDGNQITDIQALVDNTGLGEDDWCNISGNPLSEDAACIQLPALRAKFYNEWNVQSDAVCGPQATLTITINGQGTSWPEPGEHEYAVNSHVWVNARPVGGSGYAFDHWQGDVSSTNSGVEVVLDEDKSIEAVFVNSGYTFRTLTLQRTGDGQGSIEPGEGVMTYKDGQTAYINANANNGSGFGGWSGDVVSMRIGENVLMNANKSVTATFVQNGVPLTVSVEGNGNTDPWTGIHYYAPGVTVPLQAWENDMLWYFDHWEGSVNTTSLTASVAMTEPRTVTGVFSPKKALTISVSGNGSTSPASGTYYYKPNEPISLAAYPGSSNSYFAYWDIQGQPVRKQQSISITITQDTEVTAVFWDLDTAVNFPDTHLDQAVRAAIGKPTGQLYVNDLVNRRFTQLSASRLGIANLSGIEYCMDLDQLTLCHNQISDLSPLTHLANLAILNLGEDAEGVIVPSGTNAITDLSPLANLNLMTLNVSGNTGITAIDVISSLNTLMMFTVGPGDITDWSPLLDRADTLVALVIVDCGITNNDISTFGQLTNLAALGLGANPDLTDISGLSTVDLEMAIIVYSPITDMSVMQNWPSLFSLYMNGTDVTNLNALAGHSYLRDISFAGCQLTDISGLEGMTSLQNINLSDNQIIDISALETTTGVVELQLDGNQITDIQALVDNTGLGGNDACNIEDNPLSENAVCRQLRRLRAKFNDTSLVQSNAVSECHFILTVTVDGQGTSWPEPGEHSYLEGTHVWINANPVSGSGYAFDHWQGDVSSTNSGVEVVLDGDKDIEAVFVNTGYTFHTLTLSQAGTGEGYLWPNPGVYTIIDGRYMNISANPQNGSGFGGWTGDLTSMRINEYFQMNANMAITGTLVPNGVPLTIAVQGQGSTDPNPGTYYYAPGVTVPLQAWNNGEEWAFSRWMGAVNSTDLTASVVMNGAQSVTAVYEHAFDIITEDSFESGAADVSMSGLWHVTDACNAQSSGHGGTYALYYGNDAPCNYDAGASAGYAVLPEIDLREVTGTVYLAFSYFLETEQAAWAYDVATVEVSADGGEYELLANNDPESPVGRLADFTGTWQNVALDLSDYAGSMLQVRFGFDTGDAWLNDYAGFYVDDVAVYSAPPDADEAGLDASLAAVCRILNWNQTLVCDGSLDINGAYADSYRPNGVPDAVEFALLTELVTHPQRRPAAMDAACDTAAAWFANLHLIRRIVAEHYIPDAVPALAAYATLGDDDSVDFVSHFLWGRGISGFTPQAFNTCQASFLGAEGDADGDGHLNRDEWAFQACSGDEDTDIERYIDAALTAPLNLAAAAAGVSEGEAIFESFADWNGLSCAEDCEVPDFAANGLADGLEFFLLQTAVNNDCLNAVPYTGMIANTAALAAWEANLGIAETLIAAATPPTPAEGLPEFNVSAETLAAYITLGDAGSFAVADTLGRNYLGLSALNAAAFDQSLAPYLAASGDADGDGYINRIEARAMLDHQSTRYALPYYLDLELAECQTETARLHAYGRPYAARALDPAQLPFSNLDFAGDWTHFGWDPAGNQRDANGPDGGANGIPDLVEVLLLETILKTPRLDLSATGGVTHVGIADRWLDIREAFKTDLPYYSVLPAHLDLNTAYIALGDPWSVYLGRTALLTGGYTLEQPDIINGASLTAVLSACGDADGDGFSNLYEWQATPKSGDFAADAAAYIAAALDPGTQYAGYYTLTCAVQGQGSLTAYPQLDRYYPGTAVRLTALPAWGHGLRRWEGDLSGADNPATLTMDANKSVTAVFVEEVDLWVFCIPEYLDNAVAVRLNGTLLEPVEPNRYVVLEGDTVELTPSPAQRFSGWSIDLTGSASPASLTVEKNSMFGTVVAANFTPEYTLTVNVLNRPAGGTVSVAGTAQSADSATYTFLEGTQVNLAAGAPDITDFKEWQGGASGAQTSTNVTMTGDKSVIAAFYKYSQLSVQTTGDGSVSATRNGTAISLPCSVREDQQVQLTATAGADYEFARWEGTIESTDNPLTFYPENDTALIAVFLAQRALTVNIERDIDKTSLPSVIVSRSGNAEPEVTADTTVFAFLDQDYINLEAKTSGTEYDFVGWYSGQGVNTDSLGVDSSISFTLDEDKEITAQFTAYETYAEGCPLNLEFALDYTGDDPITALGLFLNLPEGWTFQDCSPAQYKMPSVNATGSLEFILNIPSSFPYRFVIAIGVPTEQPEVQSIQYHAAFHTSGDLMETQSRTKTLVEATCPVGTAHARITLADEPENLRLFRMFSMFSPGSTPEHLPTYACGYGRPHSADPDGDWRIDLTELLRVIQFFNEGGYHVAGPCVTTEDGFQPGYPANDADKMGYGHDADYNTANWRISLIELLRMIQFFNTGAYHVCTEESGCYEHTEDGYAPGAGNHGNVPLAFTRQTIEDEEDTKTFRLDFGSALQEDLSSITLTETLPCGWSFNTESLQSAYMPEPTYDAASNSAAFTWNFTESVPSSLSLEYSISSVEGYRKIVQGQAVFKFQNGCELTSKPVSTCFEYEFPEICLEYYEKIVGCGDGFTPPVFTANDIEDGDLTGNVVLTGAVDTSTPGTYALYYDVMDTDSNAALTAVCTVHVVDTTPPVITILGDNPFNIECDEKFVDPGATAFDGCDGDLTGSIIRTTPDMPEIGTYEVQYYVEDRSGKSTIVSRQVHVQPEITLLGPSIVRVNSWEDYVEPGYTISANCGNIDAIASIQTYCQKLLSTDQLYVTYLGDIYPHQYILYYIQTNAANTSLDVKYRRIVSKISFDESHILLDEPCYQTVRNSLNAACQIINPTQELVANGDPISRYHLLGLRDLNLHSQGLSTEQLSWLSYCHYLRRLNLCGNELTSLSFIVSMPELTEIYLDQNALSSLDELQTCLNLEVVVAGGYQLESGKECNHISDVSFAQNLSKLRHLDLRGYYSVEPKISGIFYTKEAGNTITSIEGLANKPALEYVNLSGNLVTSVEPLASCTDLKYLNLSNNLAGNSIAVFDWSQLANLLVLRLDFNKIETLPIGFPVSLRRLDLHGNSIADISNLDKLVNLVELNLYQNCFTSVGALSKMAQLKYLYLGNNDQLKDISALHTLADLGLAGQRAFERVNLFNVSDALYKSADVVSLEGKGVSVYKKSLGAKSSPSMDNAYLRLYLRFQGSELSLGSWQRLIGKVRPEKQTDKKDGSIGIVTESATITSPIHIPRTRFVDNIDSETEEQSGGEEIVEAGEFFIDLPYVENIRQITFLDNDGERHILWESEGISTKEKVVDEKRIGPGVPIPISCAKISGTFTDEETFVLVCLNDSYVIMDENGNLKDQLGDVNFKVENTNPAANYGEEPPWSTAIADAFYWLFRKEPFNEYQNYFNVYRLDFISDENGTKNWIDCTFPSLAFGWQHGENAGLPIPNNNFPNTVLQHLGIPYQGYVKMSRSKIAGNAWGRIMSTYGTRSGRYGTTAHEMGHLVGEIGDEYTYAGVKTKVTQSVSPNALLLLQGDAPRFPKFTDIPWRHWIINPENTPDDNMDRDCLNAQWDFVQMEWTNARAPKSAVDLALGICAPGTCITPLPTLFGGRASYDIDYWPIVGLYKKGKYRDWGFRAQNACMMNTHGKSCLFCFPCREDLVLNIVAVTTPVRAYLPPENESAVLDQGASTFTVWPYTPKTPRCGVTWFVESDSGRTAVQGDNIFVENENATFEWAANAAVIPTKPGYFLCAEVEDYGPIDNVHHNNFIHPNLPDAKKTVLKKEVCWHVKSASSTTHDADYDKNWTISADEFDAFYTYYTSGKYYRKLDTVDGFDARTGRQIGDRHSADYDAYPWSISLEELLRVVELKNAGIYIVDADGEDGFAPSLQQAYDTVSLKAPEITTTYANNIRAISIVLEQEDPIVEQLLALTVRTDFANRKWSYLGESIGNIPNIAWQLPGKRQPIMKGYQYIWTSPVTFNEDRKKMGFGFLINDKDNALGNTDLRVTCWYRDKTGLKKIVPVTVQLQQ